MPDPARRPVEIAFEALTAEDDGRTCRDIPERACDEQPGNFMRHVGALGLFKAADGLVDPKLVLSWLLAALGAPGVFIAALVPIREAGALLPQLFTAARIRAMALRKWAWSAGSAVQGLAALAIALAALRLEGAAAGWAICAALAVLAVARSVCSVAYKDVLGKTIDKGNRGTATGLAASAAPVVVIAFAVLLMFEATGRMGLVLGALALAGLLWLVAAAIFAGLAEAPGASEGGANGISAALANLRYLREDGQLARFILARGLLTSTALAPPWLVVLAAGAGEEALSGLGALVLASALAALISGYVWGRMADRSARRVLMLTGLSGAAAMGLALGFAALGLAGAFWTMPLALFVLMVAHQGVRIGRSTYLVDMAPADLRAVYTAVANTVIGLILLASGIFGALASLLGPQAVLILFATMALGGAIVANGLKELGGKT
ncbi:MFS transporter [Alkalilacustris brevis]|uniref:MFS transporter n=1 Tax=Alkalilacustris brevis TaxID=2026338 RepID=UPI000E0DA0F1|nr:MFS transporter [Alkalilacustris brevis]